MATAQEETRVVPHFEQTETLPETVVISSSAAIIRLRFSSSFGKSFSNDW